MYPFAEFAEEVTTRTIVTVGACWTTWIAWHEGCWEVTIDAGIYATGFATRVDGRGGTAIITGWALTGDPKEKREAYINRRGKKASIHFTYAFLICNTQSFSTGKSWGREQKNKASKIPPSIFSFLTYKNLTCHLSTFLWTKATISKKKKSFT